MKIYSIGFSSLFFFIFSKSSINPKSSYVQCACKASRLLIDVPGPLESLDCLVNCVSCPVVVVLIL